jgi:hypothetical protein
LQELLHFSAKVWHSIFCVGERPMNVTTQNSMRKLGRPELGATGVRAWFSYLP